MKKLLYPNLYKELITLLRGVSQVFLINNALSGALILIGIGCNSWQQALMALLGAAVARMTASLCGYERREIEDGLYGFNGVLVGIAVGVYWSIGWLSLLFVIVGAAVSTPIANCFRKRTRLPGLTAPFIIAVWALLLISAVAPEAMGRLTTAAPSAEPYPYLRVPADSFGQVMFQANALSGLLFFVAILSVSRRKALYALAAALLPMLLIPVVPQPMWREGLLGYNAVLCALYWADAAHRQMLRALLSVVLSVAVQLLAMHLHAIPLTAPFVLSVWAVWLWKEPSSPSTAPSAPALG